MCIRDRDIEGIYNHLEELKPKQKENLSNNIKQVSLSKELATIVTDLDIEESYSGLDNSIFKDKNNLEKNIEILEEFELNSTEIEKLNNANIFCVGNLSTYNYEDLRFELGLESDIARRIMTLVDSYLGDLKSA